MNAEKLAELAVKVAEPIRNEKGFIRLVTHYDADGICSGTIMYKTLQFLNKNFEIDFVRQLDRNTLKEISEKDADLFIFTDVGSGQLDTIKEVLPNKTIVVLDHHQPKDISWDNLYHLNCHLVGIDGKDDISGAGVTYILSRVLTEKVKDLITLSIIGATGDMQNENGKFKGINQSLLEDAERNGLIKVEKGLRLFGRYTRPLHKAIEYSIDPYIPEFLGNESKVIQFLQNMGIQVQKENGEWITLSDLSKDDEKRLATALVLESVAAGNPPENLIGNVYILPNNYEIREFTTLLNACGRIEKPLEGLNLCLGKQDSVDDVIAEYRRRISKYMTWLKKNLDNSRKTDKVTYLIAKNSINENFIGTVISIAIHSIFKTDIAFGFANGEDGVKVSARLKRTADIKVNLGEVIQKAAEEINGEGGGHSCAAGAKISLGKEEEFIGLVDTLINKYKDNETSM